MIYLENRNGSNELLGVIQTRFVFIIPHIKQLHLVEIQAANLSHVLPTENNKHEMEQRERSFAIFDCQLINPKRFYLLLARERKKSKLVDRIYKMFTKYFLI